MNGWKVRQLSEAVQLFLIAFTAIGFFWMDLERMIYGEVQPRIVDDLISLAVCLLSGPGARKTSTTDIKQNPKRLGF